MVSTRRIALAAAAISTLALAGCSSNSSDAGATNPAPTSQSAAPSSEAPAPSTPDTSSSSSSSSPSSSTSTSAPSPSTSQSSPSTETAGGDVASKTELVGLATTLGCTSPKLLKTSPTSPAAKMGVDKMINCRAGTKQYVLASTTPQQEDQLVKTFLKGTGSSGSMSYVSGDGWLVIGGTASNPQPPDEGDANDVKDKVGGTVKTID